MDWSEMTSGSTIINKKGGEEVRVKSFCRRATSDWVARRDGYARGRARTVMHQKLVRML